MTPSPTELTGSDLIGTGLDAVFDHAAVAAPRLLDLLPFYRDLLGGQIQNGGDNPRVGYRAMQLGFRDGSKVEIMEPLPGSTFFDRFFARGGGLHHVTFKVPELHVALEALTAAGWPTTGLFVDSDDWKEVFLHPRDAQGVLVQLAQARPGYPPPPGDLTVERILDGRGENGNGIPSV
jgi:methylmalonyl-CoA/ethylmalonyl-CoA epimerase